MRLYQATLLSTLLFTTLACDEEEPQDEGVNSEQTDEEAVQSDDELAGSENEQGTTAPVSEEVDDFCPPAWKAFAARDAHGELMNELSLTGELSTSFINDNGALALEQSEIVRVSFEAARDSIIGDQDRLAFEMLLVLEEEWMRPHAQVAASAGSQEEFDQKAFELISKEGVAQLVGEAAVEAGVAAQYTVSRCGSLYGP